MKLRLILLITKLRNFQNHIFDEKLQDFIRNFQGHIFVNNFGIFLYKYLTVQWDAMSQLACLLIELQHKYRGIRSYVTLFKKKLSISNQGYKVRNFKKLQGQTSETRRLKFKEISLAEKNILLFLSIFIKNKRKKLS